MKFLGSSPRVRGSRDARRLGYSLEGIIPAGAGLTLAADVPRGNLGDHPRGCGAHYSQACKVKRQLGSSPRVRGSLMMVRSPEMVFGIIPAGAGLTGRHTRRLLYIRDHPRGCGAHILPVFSFYKSVGSSPRVRGSLCPCSMYIQGVGIIPAGAGLTSWKRPTQAGRRDHPRGCGAHLDEQAGAPTMTGSSPRVRGSLALLAASASPPGIIPAGAGLTSMKSMACRLRRDHPRGCGAHFVEDVQEYGRLGSSPRVRGSRSYRQRQDVLGGIIPAGAGLTASMTIPSRRV